MFLTKKLRKRRILFIFFDAESSSQLQTFFTLLLSNSFQKFCRYVYLALEGREEQINFFKKILYIYIFRCVYCSYSSTYLPAKSTRFITAPFAISLPALFLNFCTKLIPTIVWALDEVAFILVLATVLFMVHLSIIASISS